MVLVTGSLLDAQRSELPLTTRCRGTEQPGGHGAVRNSAGQYGIEHPEAAGGQESLCGLITSKVPSSRKGAEWIRGRQSARGALTSEEGAKRLNRN